MVAADGEFVSIDDISVDSSTGNVYIVDPAYHRIQKFDSNGNFITKWGSEDRGDGQFDVLGDIAVDSSTGSV